MLLRGDTDFSQTHHLDRWDADGRIGFIFGYDAMQNVKDRPMTWPRRPGKSWSGPASRTQDRPATTAPGNVKDAIVRQREFTMLRLQSEEVAEFNYRPMACRRSIA